MENNLGKIISAARKNKNMSQDKLSEKLHISRQSISKWENNNNLPDLETLKRLCKILDLDYDLLKDYIVYSPQNKKRKKINKIMFVILGILLVICIIIFLLIKYRNKFEVYSVSLTDNNIVQLNNGIFIVSNVNYYFQLGDITFKNGEDLKDYKIRIYYKKNNDANIIIESNAQNNIILNESYGYGEYFDKEFDMNEMYIDFISLLNPDLVYTYKINFHSIFKDNSIVYFKETGVINNSDIQAVNSMLVTNDNLLKSGYEKVNDNYVKEVANGQFIFDTNSNILYFNNEDLNLEYNLNHYYITGTKYDYSSQSYNINYLYDLNTEEIHCFSEVCNEYETYNNILFEELEYIL